MTVVVSLHDVSPATLAASQRLRDDLGTAGITRATLLVIPDHHGRGATHAHAPTVRWLRARVAAGDELAQHGHVHLARARPRGLRDRLRAAAFTRGEGECLTQTAAERAAMLGPVRRRLEDALGIGLRGFVAPAWLEPRDLAGALARAGFGWHESRGSLAALDGGRRLRAPVLTFAGGSPVRVAASRGYVRALAPLLVHARVARLALHPCDDGDPAVRARALAVAARLARAGAHAVATASGALALVA